MMPMLDMPIEKLGQYKGSSICPPNFETYWNEQKRCADELVVKYQLIKKSFNNPYADYYDLYFRGIDGALIYAKYICPSHGKKVPTVIQFHDYKQSSKGWHYLTRYIGIGYAVLAMDCRGQGGKSEDKGGICGSTVCGHLIAGLEDELDQLYYRKVYLDAYLLSKIAFQLPKTSPSEVTTYGVGQGGALAITTAVLNPSVSKCVAQAPFLADFKRVWEMDLDLEAYEGIRYYFRWFDPMHLKEDMVFTKLGYLDVVNFAPYLKSSLLVGTGLMDRICPPSTQYAIVNQAMCPKKHVVFAKFSHELINAFEDEYLKFLTFD